MLDHVSTSEGLPVLVIGAGVSGLLLAQQLRMSKIPFRIFERDNDLLTRGVGWGLTLHWSLPALRQLLPQDLLAQLPQTYVDRAAVERGESSTFPFFDLSTGELKGSSPKASEDQRVRVTRQRLRKLLATGIDIQWEKAFQGFHEDDESVTAVFEDGTTCQGQRIIGCDGSHSRVRRAVFPEGFANYQIPVRMFGFTMRVIKEQARPILDLDPFFLQGTASANDTFMYISLLESPDRVEPIIDDTYTYQICISANTNTSALNQLLNKAVASTSKERIDIIKQVARDWAEPFCSFVSLIPDTTDVKQLDIDDFPPSSGKHGSERVLLVGDASHAMTMYRGEGANHAIVDILDFKEKILPQLHSSDSTALQSNICQFRDGVIARTRPAVLASRQACLDAHDWHGLSASSPLLTRRQMILNFDG
ncbi:FAD binding domain-containing protein [Pyrenochaeta sp. MPI-SDFR-AT-0127]|nr:FAD binding domain-containing protein [Pyrenochaeta sp. MPI-SDFR-AT-0127]